MAMFMETTKVEDVTTVAEIQRLLATRGASSVMVEYKDGRVDGLAFRFRVGEQEVPFRLPCRWQAIESLLKRKGKRATAGDSIEAKSRRIAWRQILRWVEAQLALIETGMVKTQEVFLPYAIVRGAGDDPGGTMFEVMERRSFLLSEAANDAASERAWR